MNQRIHVSKAIIGRVILHCLDKLLDAQATRAEHDAFEIKEVKLEGVDVKPPMDTLKMKVDNETKSNNHMTNLYCRNSFE